MKILRKIKSFSFKGTFFFFFYALSSQSKDCEKARYYFNQAIALKGDVAGLLKKEYLYKKAIELCPTYVEAHNNLGDVYEKQGRYDEAIRKYTLASILNPKIPYPYFGLGDVYFKLGKYEQAIINYEKGLKIENDKESEENLKIARAFNVKILFYFDSDKLTDKAIEQLNAMVIYFPIFEDPVFEIQGHTDSIGSENYNLHLSQRRAEMVKKYLVEKGGIPESRLRAKGYGEDRPIADNRTKKGRQMNRRVEVKKILVPVELKTR